MIPYTLQVKVGGHTFFDWLITKHFPQNKTSISFITFLFVRNGLFYDKTHTFSDYLTATVIHDFITKPEYHENIWILIEILYFMQIKNFNRKSNILFSQEKPESLRSFIEKSMSIKDPIKFIFNSECLYLNYKFELIERLSSKYKINDGGEFTLEKQFLNMDLFYRKN